MRTIAEEIELEIDTEALLKELEAVDQRIQQTKQDAQDAIEEVDKARAKAFDEVLNTARGGYLMMMGVVRMGGESMSYMFRSMISAAFSTIHALKVISLGKKMITRDWISFAMEMGQLGLAISATILAEAKQQELARSLMGAKMGLMGLQQLLGVINL